MESRSFKICGRHNWFEFEADGTAACFPPIAMTDSPSATATPPWTDVRPMNKSRKDYEKVPVFFRVTEDVRAAMQHQIDEVGVDGQKFAYEKAEQGTHCLFYSTE